MSEAKKYAPTPQKLRKLRPRGIVPVSHDLSAAVALAAGLAVLAVDRERIRHGLSGLMSRQFEAIPERVTAWYDAETHAQADLATRLLGHVAGQLLLYSLPILGAAALSALAVGWLQTGGLVSTQRLSPDFSHLNPFAGLRRLFFDRDKWLDQGRLAAKVLIVSLVLWCSLRPSAAALLSLHHLDWDVAGGLLVPGLTRVLGWSAAGYLLLGALDLLVQRFLFLAKHRMSREELKQGMKEAEGNPLMRQVRKSIGRDLLEADVKSTVPRCDLVLNNPTHLSVGVRFSRRDRTVAWVMVKGADARALSIREMAGRSGIPTVDNIPLARALMGVGERARVPKALVRTLLEVLVWLHAHPQGSVNSGRATFPVNPRKGS